MIRTMSELPDGYWRNETACRLLDKHYAKHMVALLVVYKSDKTTGEALYSGFLYRHQGIPLWMTAGHVLSELDRLRETGVDIIKAEWLDLQDDGSGHGIPVDIRDLCYLQLDHQGVDFGFVFLRPHYEALFMSLAGKAFLDQGGYYRRENAKPEGFHLIGFPSERCEVTERIAGELAERSLSAPLYCLPLERIPDRRGDVPTTFWGCDGCFYFRMMPFDMELTPPPNEIKGMSGGPIVSTERTPQGSLKYYLFGIQSSWLPRRRIIRATDMRIVGDIIDEFFMRMREEAHLTNPPKEDEPTGPSP